MNIKTMTTKILSLVMVLALLLGSSATTISAVAAADFSHEETVIDYVSIGASNTNGYGHLGYLPEEVSEDPLAASKADLNDFGYMRAPANAYPSKIATALQAYTGKDVNLSQLAISSMRVEELRILLDDSYAGDAYTDWRFYDVPGVDRYYSDGSVMPGSSTHNWFGRAGGLESVRNDYRTAIANAEYITIDMGWNNFGVYAFNNIKTILSDGNYYPGAPDFSLLDGVDEQINYESLKTIAFNYLKGNMDMSNADLVEKLDMIADVLAYTTIGACYHFDKSMEKIYELNPDVQVIVLNIQNLADDLVVEFEGMELNLGEIYGYLIQVVDDYRLCTSPYAEKYMFANTGDIETFLDEIVAWDGNPETLTRDMKDCFDMYDDNLYVRSIVEYLMVGQALSGLFQGFRDMAAGYGLSVFVDDSTYTYEFALTRTVDQLLSLDLSKLDLNNPAGADKDVELYGQAVAKHLKNLRGDAANVAAYDYVFDGLVEALETQKAQLLAMVEGVPEAYWPAELVAGLAEIDQALTAIIPAAKAEFANKLQAVYDTYHNTLNYAYDVVATFMQYAASINTLKFGADSLNGFNSAADALVSIVANDFINGALAKFNYELYANGLSNTAVDPVEDYVLDESIFADDALRAIAVLAVRYELGNSFFAHPNVKGNQQVTDAVMLAIKRGVTAKEDSAERISTIIAWLMNFAESKYPGMFDVFDEFGAILNSAEYQILSSQLKTIYNKYVSATTEEQRANLESQTFQLLSSLRAIAAKYTNKQLDLNNINYYVSLGDSTINGYGLTGYVDNMQNGVEQVVAGSAHVLLAQKIFGEDWKDSFANFCQGSLRADDLLLFLGGEVELDDYYYAEIEPNLMEGTLEATQEKYIANVANADLISVAIGGGNFLTFAGKYVNRVLGTTAGDPYKLDWARIGVESDKLDELKETLDMIVPLVDGMGLMDGYLPEGVEIEDPAKLAYALVEGLVYGYASYIYYYNQVLERIAEINPDAHIVILGMFNPVDDWAMSTTIDGEEVTISIGGIVNVMLESANILPLEFAIQNENATFVDTSAAETILEAEKPGQQLGFNDYYNSSFQSNGKAVHASAAGHEYIANQMYDAITTEYSEVELAKDAVEAFINYVNNLDSGIKALVIDEFIDKLDEIVDFVNNYYLDAYAFAYDKAVEYGVIDAMADALDAAAAEIDGLVAYAEKHLDANALSLVVSAADAAKAQLAALKAHIYEVDEIDVEKVTAIANAIVKTVNKFIEVYNTVVPAVEDLIAEIDAKYGDEIAKLTAEVTAKLEALYEELAVAEAREASARQSRKNNSARSVAEIKAEIAQVEADFAAAIENLKALRDAQIEAAKAAINNAKAIAINLKNAVVNVVNGVEFIVNTVDAYVEALLALEYQELAAAAVAIFKEYAPAVATKVANWFAANQDTILDLVVANGDNILAYLEANSDDILAFVGFVADKLGVDALAPIVDKMLEEALTFDYTVDGDSNVLVIGGEYYVDENEHYAKYLAEYLGINSFSLLSNGTLRVSDLLAILNADFVNDAYGNAFLGEDIDAMRELYAEAIASSDLITVEFGVADFTNFVINQLLGKIMDDYGAEIDALIGSLGLPASLPNLSAYELDWSRFGALSTVVDIDAALAQIKATLIEKGIPEYQEIDLGGYTLGIAVADYATYAIECFVYALANYAHNLDDAILAINAINPDAQIVVLGALNALEGITFEISGTEINVGEYASYLVKALDAQAFLHALALPNTTYVSIEGAELYYDAATITDLISLALDEIDGEIVIVPQINPELLTPSAAGHAYIAEQIIAAMTVTCGHAYDWCYDADCNICGAIREITGHVYDDECDATCNLCDYVRVGVGHVYDDCYDAICNICGGERVVVGHIYNNRCDATCNNCDYIRVVAGHQYDNACDEYCNVCGSERLVGAHEYTNACDATCNICGDTREVAGHQYDNACDADCNVCGETRVPAAHVYDNCVDTECNVCGNVREALEHTFGEWEITKEATTEAEGEKQRVCSACGETETETIAKLTPSTPTIPEKKPGTTTPSTEDEKKPLGAGAVVGIVAGSVVVAGTGAFAIYWFAIQKSSFAALGTAIKGAAKGAGAAFKKLGEKIANLFKKNK